MSAAVIDSYQGRRKGPHFLADQLTLFQPGGADYAHHIITGPLPPQIFSPSGIPVIDSYLVFIGKGPSINDVGPLFRSYDHSLPLCRLFSK
jgi:hypothetical protein